MLKDGMFIQNRYEIISLIGSGGMADVYKARDHKLNRFVAVKVLKKEYREDKIFISKFRAEAQAAAGLAHANIVNVYDTGEEAGLYFIVMELVEGITLKEYINNKGKLSVREATSVALQISAGLEAAHNNGIVHRDVKPQNIIISTDGKVKVTDFGIARAASSNTINSGVMGSVHYSSPEQSRGGYSDEKSDIYSLGITMYEMLTGQVPFDGDTAVAVALRHLQENLQGPRAVVPEIPYSTDQIVVKCTQKSPDRRYSNMSELIRDLRESLVNPEGDFVVQQIPDCTSQTIIMSKDEVKQINAERGNLPTYDESMDVGAAAALHEKENSQSVSRAYQPGSYYQNSNFQGVSPGRQEQAEPTYGFAEETLDPMKEYDPYYDAYDNPDDYAIHDGKQEGNYRLDESFVPPKEKRKSYEDDDMDVGLSPRLEKIVTVGGIIVAVIIGCIFLALLANAFGILDFGRKNRSTEKTTEKQTEVSTEAQQSAEVAAPEIRGKMEADALEALEQAGLVGIRKGEVSDSQYNAGEVVSQSSAAGTLLEKGAAVEYEVAAADAAFALSDLSNLEQSQAQAFLLTQGLQSQTEAVYSDTVSSGHVVSTEPEANSMVKTGDTITLFVSQGTQTEPENAVYVQFWSLVGYTKERADEALAMMGLVGDYQYAPSNTIAEGMIVSQSPDPSQEIAQGSTVTLVVSTGPDTSGTSDDVQGTSADNAVQIQNNGQGIWKCDAQLGTPAGYTGQSVRITLVQNGVESTIFEGSASFPYRMQVQGPSGVDSGTAYVYLLDDVTGEVTSKIEYPGITFTHTAE